MAENCNNVCSVTDECLLFIIQSVTFLYSPAQQHNKKFHIITAYKHLERSQHQQHVCWCSVFKIVSSKAVNVQERALGPHKKTYVMYSLKNAIKTNRGTNRV